MKPLRDHRNRRDPHGYKLKASVEAVADELACAAGLVCGKLNRTPACIVRGYTYEPAAGTVKDLLRPARRPISSDSSNSQLRLAILPSAEGPSACIIGFPSHGTVLLSYGSWSVPLLPRARRRYTVLTENDAVRELTSTELSSFPSLDWLDIATARCSIPPRVVREKPSKRKRRRRPLTRRSLRTRPMPRATISLGLLVAANMLRAELTGNIVTYVVNRNMNFTNICFVGCKFCAFSRGPRESDAYFHSLETMAQKAREAWQLGATEVCIQGGLPRELDKFYYRDILRAIKSAVPQMHIHAFSPMEIVYGVELTGMPLADYLSMLRDNGLGTLPGTAAEVLDDEIRHVLSANKLSTAQWVEVIGTAHRCGIRTTSTLMYGHCRNSRTLGARQNAAAA